MPILALAGAAVGGITSAIGGNAQANAAKNALKVQQQNQQQALSGTAETSAEQKNNLNPYLQTGNQANSELQQQTNQPGQGLLSNFTGSFQAPTADQAAATPGYQFQLQQGQKALENSAAAKGGVLSGGTAKALDQYSQGLASTNYQQTYNNAFQNYLQNYNQFETNQGNQFNRLSQLAGTGQNAATSLNSDLGQNNQVNAGVLTNGANQQAQQINNAGAATASGYVGAGNAVSNGVNNYQQYSLLNSLISPQAQSAPSNVAATGAYSGSQFDPTSYKFQNQSGY